MKKKKAADQESSPSRIVKCPECGKDSVYGPENPFRPFCSERCRILDLGSWASESYRVASPPDSSSDEEIPEDDGGVLN